VRGLQPFGSSVAAGLVLAGAAGCAGQDQSEAVPDAVEPSQRGCPRPYARASPWNTPIGRRPVYDRRSPERIASIDGPLTSDPTQYTYPVYDVTRRTPRKQVEISGWYSHVSRGNRRLRNQREGRVRMPIPAGAAAAAGSDSQIILVDWRRGDEWGAWRLEQDDGGWRASNASHYNVRWDAVPPRDPSGRPYLARGAGIPYLAGLVRRCEIRRGRIGHALAFAYDYPSPEHVYPASKSDGKNSDPDGLPEGSRLQLDPRLSSGRIRSWGCTGPCLVIAKALQRYGMYVVDNSGRPKLMLEYEGTARWNGRVDSETVSPIPLEAFRVLESCTRVGTPRNDLLRGGPERDVLCGLRGRDRLFGGGGRDRLLGGMGADRLYARDGERDVVDGGSGADRARVDPGLDRLRSARGGL